MPHRNYTYTNNKTLQANFYHFGLLTEDIIYYNKMVIESFMGSMGGTVRKKATWGIAVYSSKYKGPKAFRLK